MYVHVLICTLKYVKKNRYTFMYGEVPNSKLACTWNVIMYRKLKLHKQMRIEQYLENKSC